MLDFTFVILYLGKAVTVIRALHGVRCGDVGRGDNTFIIPFDFIFVVRTAVARESVHNRCYGTMVKR